MVVRSKTGWSGGRELGKASSSFYSHLSIKAGFCVYPSWQTEGRKERRGSQSWVFVCEHASCDGRGEHSKRETLLLVFTIKECLSRVVISSAVAPILARWPVPHLVCQVSWSWARRQTECQVARSITQHPINNDTGLEPSKKGALRRWEGPSPHHQSGPYCRSSCFPFL